jgi:hypothetical protein
MLLPTMLTKRVSAESGAQHGENVSVEHERAPPLKPVRSTVITPGARSRAPGAAPAVHPDA